MNKKLVAIFAVVVLCACSVAVAIPLLNNNEEKPALYDNTIDITFDNEYSKYTCKYSDEYFFDDSGKYIDCLATASYVREAVADINKDPDRSKHTANVRHYLEKAEFPITNFDVNDDYLSEPTEDTIGTFAASKTITKDGKTFTLITVGFRCSDYALEWVNNVTFGNGTGDEYGHHEGFKKAADRAIEWLNSYIDKHAISGDTKLWITGFSRGAAVANVIGGMLDTAIEEGKTILSNINLEKNGLFVYTFESPRTVAPTGKDVHGDAYNNIWNHVSKGDVVASLPCGWGFTLYGNTKEIPTMNVAFDLDKDGWNGMIGYYERCGGNREDLKVGAYKLRINLIEKKISIVDISSERQDKVLGDYVSDLTEKLSGKLCNTREKYVNDIQPIIRELVEVLMVESLDSCMAFAKSLYDSLKNDETALKNAAMALYNEDKTAFFKAVGAYITKALDDAKIECEVEQFENNLYDLLVMIAKVAIKNYSILLEPLGTFIKDIEQISNQHGDYTITYCWLMSWDRYYG